jgi:hypothetical protein
MRGRPKTRGTIKETTPQGASVKLDDGRDGLVSRTDCFWNEWVGKRALAAGDSVAFVTDCLSGSALFDILERYPDSVIVLENSPNDDRPNYSCAGGEVS